MIYKLLNLYSVFFMIYTFHVILHTILDTYITDYVFHRFNISYSANTLLNTFIMMKCFCHLQNGIYENANRYFLFQFTPAILWQQYEREKLQNQDGFHACHRLPDRHPEQLPCQRASKFFHPIAAAYNKLENTY